VTSPKASLIRRLIRWQVVTMVVTWTVLCAWLIFQMSVVENGDLDRRMVSFAATLAETAAGAHARPEEMAARLQAVERVFVNGVIETLEDVDPYVATYQVIDARNQVLYREGAAPETPWMQGPGFADVQYRKHHFRLVRTQSYDGSIAVIVAESDAMRRASLLPILSMVGGSEIMTLLISIAVLWWTAHRGFSPVGVLASEVANRKEGDLMPIEDHAGYRELAPLISAFNDLLQREAARLDTERGFLADAAHELRTPLAAISAQAHRLTAATDDDTRRAASEQLQLGVQRVSHLLTQLLLTARIDASPVFLKREPIDAAELLRLRMASFVPIARRKSIDIALEAPESAMVTANAFGLTSIIENLIDNAIRHTPAGGSVLVTLTKTPHSAELLVQDNGPGIAPELHERVFERFYRVPGSEAEGSGLGLAIVRKLAEAYGSRILLGLGLDGKGLSVALVFEAAPPTGTA
jgi:signal transduction histidine kinase